MSQVTERPETLSLTVRPISRERHRRHRQTCIRSLTISNLNPLSLSTGMIT